MYKVETAAIKETKISGGITVFFKAIALAVLFTAAVFLLFSLLICFTPVAESCVPVVSLVTMAVSVLICSSVFCRSAKSRGYLKGAISGLGYVFVIYLASAFLNGGIYFNAYSLLLMFLGVFVGCIGGILGINMKDKRRR